MEKLSFDALMDTLGKPEPSDWPGVKDAKQHTIARINEWAKDPLCTGIVVYECGQMDSTKFGRRQMLRCGPNNTLSMPEEAKEKMPWFEPEGLASGRMHATAYWSKA